MVPWKLHGECQICDEGVYLSSLNGIRIGYEGLGDDCNGGTTLRIGTVLDNEVEEQVNGFGKRGNGCKLGFV